MVTLDREALRAFGREITMFLPDLVLMLRRVVADPRVPHSAKVEAAGALAYLVSPKNRITNMIPVVGQLDDVAIVAFAFRRLVVGAGEPILREHWRGSDRGFQVLIGASSALASPAGAIRRAKLARSIVAAGIDRVRGGAPGRRAAVVPPGGRGVGGVPASSVAAPRATGDAPGAAALRPAAERSRPGARGLAAARRGGAAARRRLDGAPAQRRRGGEGLSVPRV
jgi:uncharacterized membrane protein YkvA (DUF1232 family)